MAKDACLFAPGWEDAAMDAAADARAWQEEEKYCKMNRNVGFQHGIIEDYAVNNGYERPSSWASRVSLLWRPPGAATL